MRQRDYNPLSRSVGWSVTTFDLSRFRALLLLPNRTRPFSRVSGHVSCQTSTDLSTYHVSKNTTNYTYHQNTAGVRREEDEDVPKSVQIWEMCALPDVAKESIVHPANEAEDKEKAGPNSESNSPRITTSVLQCRC